MEPTITLGNLEPPGLVRSEVDQDVRKGGKNVFISNFFGAEGVGDRERRKEVLFLSLFVLN